jgi:hypothetical protein
MLIFEGQCPPKYGTVLAAVWPLHQQKETALEGAESRLFRDAFHAMIPSGANFQLIQEKMAIFV